MGNRSWLQSWRELVVDTSGSVGAKVMFNLAWSMQTYLTKRDGALLCTVSGTFPTHQASCCPSLASRALLSTANSANSSQSVVIPENMSSHILAKLLDLSQWPLAIILDLL